MEEDAGVAMGLPVAAQVEAVPSRPAAEVTVAVVDIAAAARGAEEIVVVGTVEAETAAATVEVVIGAEAAVTEVAAAVDARLRRSTRPPPEESPRPMPR